MKKFSVVFSRSYEVVADTSEHAIDAATNLFGSEFEILDETPDNFSPKIAENGKINLYYHKTDGGAEYLTDKFILCPNGDKEGIFEGANYVIRIDGDITKDAELTLNLQVETSIEELCKELEFTLPAEYFDYILESIINGQRGQAKNLISDLSKADRKAAYQYFDIYGTDEEASTEEAKHMIFEQI